MQILSVLLIAHSLGLQEFLTVVVLFFPLAKF